MKIHLHALAFSAVALLLPYTQLSAAESGKLLPFQGRITGPSGIAFPDGSRVVQFKIYNAPVGGEAVWNGEVHKVSVNNGLVNTILGSKASLDSIDFNQSLYLEITVDANSDNQITAADPPLLPRQTILPAPFAKESANSRMLAGHDWTPIFGTNNPAVPIPGSKLGEDSLPGSKLQPATITSNQIAPQTIDLDKLAAKVLERLVPVGTIAAFAGDAKKLPDGWLLCDGSGITRSMYENLYDLLGGHWGSLGEGVYRVPDLRGVFLRGVDDSPAHGPTNRDPDRATRSAYEPGAHSGPNVGSVQGDETKSHTHDFISAGSANIFAAYPNADPRFLTLDHNQVAEARGTYHNAIVATGGTETRPKNAYVNYIIKY